MVMEVGQAMAGTRWTSTAARPFRPAPGGGLGSTRWTSTVPTPFGPAPGAGSLGYVSGFAVSPDPREPGAESIEMDPLLVLGRGPFRVVKESFRAGEVPSMVVRFRFTDRGGLTKGILDANVREILRKAGYTTSKATSFKPEPVTWRWQKDPGGTFYMAVVATPSKWAGMRYAGTAFGSDLIYEPDAAKLGKLPTNIWVYTIAITTRDKRMTDGDGAQVITLLKQAMVNMSPNADYAHVLATVRSCPYEVFGPKPTPPKPLPDPMKPQEAKVITTTGIVSSLVLLAAWNMLASHVGSEVL